MSLTAPEKVVLNDELQGQFNTRVMRRHDMNIDSNVFENGERINFDGAAPGTLDDSMKLPQTQRIQGCWWQR